MANFLKSFTLLISLPVSLVSWNLVFGVTCKSAIGAYFSERKTRQGHFVYMKSSKSIASNITDYYLCTLFSGYWLRVLWHKISKPIKGF